VELESIIVFLFGVICPLVALLLVHKKDGRLLLDRVGQTATTGAVERRGGTSVRAGTLETPAEALGRWRGRTTYGRRSRATGGWRERKRRELLLSRAWWRAQDLREPTLCSHALLESDGLPGNGVRRHPDT